jgi:hypothetical protein
VRSVTYFSRPDQEILKRAMGIETKSESWEGFANCLDPYVRDYRQAAGNTQSERATFDSLPSPAQSEWQTVLGPLDQKK